MIAIKDPFKTDLDVTDKTPLDDIPNSYRIGVKGRWKDEALFDKAVLDGIGELSVNPGLEDFILKEVHLSVSAFDDHVIKTVFHAAVSAYASPLNLALKAESGSGKSYGTIETIKFLPCEDVLLIGSQSPKVISHENGVKKTADGRLFEEIPEPCKPEKSDYPDNVEYNSAYTRFFDELKAYRKLQDNCFYEVDLRGKIIVFLESVNPETFKMLKATMSHDNDYIDHKYVDDKGRVHVTRLIGSPVLIFNSLDSEYMSEFATRTLTISPNTTKEKIADAMRISEEKACFPWLFSSDRLNKVIIQQYLAKIRDNLKAGNIKTIDPFYGVIEAFSKSQPRDMRDFNKFLELMPSYAMVKLFQRPIIVINKQRYLVPTIQDFLDAKAVFDSVSETTKTGTEQRIISFYWDFVADKANGSTLEVLTEQYNKDRRQKLSSKRIREWLNRLVEIEFVDAREGEQETAKGYVDRQKITYHPLKQRNNGNNLILQIGIDLKANLEIAFDKWLKTCPFNIGSTPPLILNIDGSASQISMEEFVEVVKGNIPSSDSDKGEPSNNNSGRTLFSGQVFTSLSNAVQETKLKTIPIVENGTFPILKYRRLTPSEAKHCDGESVGNQCPLLAAYEMVDSENTAAAPAYCETHFSATRKSCVENGYRLEELQQ